MVSAQGSGACTRTPADVRPRASPIPAGCATRLGDPPTHFLRFYSLSVHDNGQLPTLCEGPHRAPPRGDRGRALAVRPLSPAAEEQFKLDKHVVKAFHDAALDRLDHPERTWLTLDVTQPNKILKVSRYARCSAARAAHVMLGTSDSG